VVGFVNIHTHQAEMMLDYFENIAQPWTAASSSAAAEHIEADPIEAD
jgi:hypothetical protein